MFRGASVKLESLETRLLFSKPAPITKFSQPEFFFGDVAATDSGGSGQSASQMLIIRNAGTLPLIFNSKGLRILGPDAADFFFTGKSVPAVIAPGALRSVPIAFKAPAEGTFTATLLAKSNDTKHKSVSIPLRGLGTRGEGGDFEPSLQQIMDFLQIPDNVGDSNPADTNFKVPPVTPNDEVDMQQLVKAGPGVVTITPMAMFVNDFDPAEKVGYYRPGQDELGDHPLFSLSGVEDGQAFGPPVHGKTKFDPGDDVTFGLYTSYPAFNSRKSFSEDALNTWEPKAQNRRKIRFYPMKTPDGTVVPNTFVFAGEDFNQVYDFQDGVFVISNVMRAGGTPTIGIQNADGSPSNDHLVFNRITNLDPVRPNVVHDTDVLDVINSGDATLTVSSLKLSDNVNFKIVSGGGSNIKIAPHSLHAVTLQFVAAPTSGLSANYSATLTVNSDDPDDPVRTVTLGGIWENSSEQTATHQYSEPSLKSLVSVFGYTTTILNPGQTTDHGGHPVPVGDEILEPYWDQAEPADPVFVRQLAAFHRQNNFDPVTGLPLTAASSIFWYSKGKSTTLTKIFTHNIDEGQALLPQLSGSTTKMAQGTFRQKDSTPFGFNVDKTHFTDDSLNQLDFNPNDPNQTGIPGTGHSFRIFPLKDENGNLVPNTYLFAMDYTANIFANWDYNDNLYIISNIKPADASATPMAVTASPSPKLAPAADLFSAKSVLADPKSSADVLPSDPSPADSLLR